MSNKPTYMQNYVVISALGAHKAGLLDALSKASKEAGCNILDSRMGIFGNQFASIMLLSGTWDAIAKIENSLPRLEQQLGVTLISKRSEKRRPTESLMPYAIEVVAADRPGIVYEITVFFSSRGINIEEMYTASYNAAHSGTPMFSLHMTISISAETSIAALRGEFMDLCDQLNLDAVMEPVK